MAIPVRKGWLCLLSAYRLIQCNQMQKYRKNESIEKMCDKLPNGRYDIEEYFAVFADYFRPCRSKETCHFSEKSLFLNNSKI